MSLNDIVPLFVLLLAAFVPAVLALIWIRSGERGRKERWSDLTLTFLFGAIIAIIIAIALELLAVYLLTHTVSREYDLFARDPTAFTFIMVIILVPIIEEFTKMLSVIRFSRYIWRPRNGLVFGAAAGLGFAATENFLYEGTAFFSAGLTAFIVVALVRSFSSAFMHASATSISGYGVARSKSYGGHWWPYFVLAVVMHASFNLFASFGVLFTPQLGVAASGIGLAFSLILVLVSVLFVRSRIHGYNP